MNEQSFISALEEISGILGQLALQATEPDDPLAFPEPRDDDEIAVFSGHIDTLRGQVGESYHTFLNTTLRDYKAGYSDRCGAYLVEFVEKLQADSGFSGQLSADDKSKLNFLVTDLREL